MVELQQLNIWICHANLEINPNLVTALINKSTSTPSQQSSCGIKPCPLKDPYNIPHLSISQTHMGTWLQPNIFPPQSVGDTAPFLCRRRFFLSPKKWHWMWGRSPKFPAPRNILVNLLLELEGFFWIPHDKITKIWDPKMRGNTNKTHSKIRWNKETHTQMVAYL